jgi:hypothetical protein
MNGTTTAGPPQISPVEFVKSLPPEAKQAVFLALLREVLALSGGTGLIPVTDEDGRPLGYYVPPEAAKARAEALLAEMPPEVREAMTRPLPPDFDPDDCLSDEELEVIRREACSESPG